MNRKQMALVVLALVSCIWLWHATFETQAQEALDPIVSPLPSPTVPPHSPEADLALQYVATHEQIPQEELRIAGEEPVHFELLQRSYQYVVVLHLLPESTRHFELLVDPATGAIETDIAGVRRAEQEAYTAKYGKLRPTLYEHLQTVTEEELIGVAIWVTLAPESRTPREIEAEVAHLYPEALAVWQQGGRAWDVADPELAAQIRRAYFERLAADAALRTAPVVAWLEEQGIPSKAEGMAPVVEASLTKAQVLTLAEHPAVATIYLSEGKPEPASDISTNVVRVPSAWSAGLRGEGVRVAIMEPDAAPYEGTNINSTAANCLNIVSRYKVYPATDHTSRVAAIVGCSDNNRPGVAQGFRDPINNIYYGVDMIDSGYDPDVDAFQTVLNDAINTRLADIVNMSFSIYTDNQLYGEDQLADWYARYTATTIVVAAGNTSGNVATPGKAWNVITVGNFEDRNSVNWGGDPVDQMRSSSGYINPGTGVEKPEVVAPGTDISTVAGQDTGTSLAAPHVSGVAALMMERDVELKTRPASVKAILMASAAHNIRDGRIIVTGQDLRDGAGSVNAALAVQMASHRGGINNNASTCDRPCWWDTGEIAVSPNGSFNRFFYANRGDLVRVVVVWNSYAHQSHILEYNFDMNVRIPGGSFVVSSMSSVNNYEIVEFVAPETNAYQIEIRRSSNDSTHLDPTNWLGIAWTKQAAYLPSVQDTGTWDTRVHALNRGATDRNIGIRYNNADVNASRSANGVLISNALATYQGPATIGGSEDVIAIGRVFEGSTHAIMDNAFMPSGFGDAAFEQAYPTLFLPAFYKNSSNLNTTLYIQNVGASPTTVRVDFYSRDGTSDRAWTSGLISAYGTLIVNTSHIPDSQWVGSIKLTASQPLVAKAYETASGIVRSYNASANGRAFIVAPLAYKTAFGFNTGLVVQNIGSSSTNVTITYCPRQITTSTPCVSAQAFRLDPMRAVGRYLPNESIIPNGWTGSIKIETTGGVPVVAVCNNLGTNGVSGYDYSFTGGGSRLTYLPYAARRANSFTTAFAFRNVSSSIVTVNARYYNGDGTRRAAADQTFTLDPGEADAVALANNANLPDGWEGSIILESSNDIVAVLRAEHMTLVGSYASSLSAYNGLARYRY